MTVRHALFALPAVVVALILVPTSADATEVTYADTVGSVHEDAIRALTVLDVVRGCEDARFCPEQELTRAQVATIVARALELDSPGPTLAASFGDTADSAHLAAIEAVAAAELMAGCDEGQFCPHDPVTRGQLASVLVRAFELPPAPEGLRTFDDAAGIHEAAIASVTAAGISSGCDLVTFCTSAGLQRGQAASFIARALDLIDRVEVAPYEERKAAYDERVAEEQAARAAAEEEARARAAAQHPGLKAVEVAMAQIGKPYRWGGSGPSSFDCSGLTSFAWRAAGVELPRTSRDQYRATTRISRSELRPGDLVFYHSPISHVAMYIGDGKVVEAPSSGRTVHVRNDGLTRRGIVGYGRP